MEIPLNDKNHHKKNNVNLALKQQQQTITDYGYRNICSNDNFPTNPCKLHHTIDKYTIVPSS